MSQPRKMRVAAPPTGFARPVAEVLPEVTQRITTHYRRFPCPINPIAIR